MEISYWKSRWQKDNTGWHMDQVYPHLMTYWDRLELNKGDTILLPLCGKSLDIPWLLDKGLNVIGVEVSDKAISELKNHLDFSFTEKSRGHFKVFESTDVQLWLGNFFDIQASYLPKIDAIYDKAALIALPPKMRNDYAEIIKSLCTEDTRMFLNCFEYPQDSMSGPPFAIFEEEIRTLYDEQFSIELLHKESMMEQLAKFQQRGLSGYLNEKVYLLSPK